MTDVFNTPSGAAPSHLQASVLCVFITLVPSITALAAAWVPDSRGSSSQAARQPVAWCCAIIRALCPIARCKCILLGIESTTDHSKLSSRAPRTKRCLSQGQLQRHPISSMTYRASVLVATKPLRLLLPPTCGVPLLTATTSYLNPA